MRKQNLYIISLLVLISGIVFSVLYILNGYNNLGNTLETMRFPGTNQVQIASSGNYTLYHEYKTYVNGTYLNNEDIKIGDYEIDIINENTKDSPGIIRLDGAKNYSYKGRSGETVYEFEADETGTYLISFEPASPAVDADREFIVSLDRGFHTQRVKIITGAQFLAIVPAIIALIIFTYAYTKDRRETE